MNEQKGTSYAKIKRLQSLYNAVPNTIWSLLGFVPVSVFCYKHTEPKFIYIFSAISIIPLFLPNIFFDKIQISKSTALYKKLGILFINRFAQNGAIINGLIKKQFPDFKVVEFKRQSAKKLIQQTYIFEKFHFILFVFFSLVTVYAMVKQYFLWAFVIALTNIIYNIYPNLLQQYIRVKLKHKKTARE